MHPAPASILSFDPAPQNTRRESADRGFADLLARAEPAAKADRPRTAAEKAERHEPPTDSDARPAPAAAEPAAGEETGESDPSGRDPAMADAAADPDEPAPETDTDPSLDIAVAVPQAEPAAPPAAVTPAPGATQSAAAADAAFGTVAENASTTPVAGAGEVAAEGATVPGTDDAVDAVTGGKAPAAAQPIVHPPQDEDAARSLTDTAIVQPASSEQVQAATTAAATAAPRPAGAARDNSGMAGPTGPASSAAANGGDGAGGDTSDGLPQDGDAVAAAAGDRVTGQNKGQDTAIRGAAMPAQAVSDQSAAGPRVGAPEILAANSETGQRPDAPAVAQGHAASPSTSFANELRIATGAPPAADATARMPSGPVVDQMAVQISRAVSEGQDKLTIDLRPAVLGRVSVSLELGHDHRVIAVISADRADTLDLLQRDVRGLERALQDAGLKTDSGSLSFSLNGDGARESPFSNGADAEQIFATQPSDDEADSPATAMNPYARILGPTGVDIHV